MNQVDVHLDWSVTMDEFGRDNFVINPYHPGHSSPSSYKVIEPPDDPRNDWLYRKGRSWNYWKGRAHQYLPCLEERRERKRRQEEEHGRAWRRMMWGEMQKAKRSDSITNLERLGENLKDRDDANDGDHTANRNNNPNSEVSYYYASHTPASTRKKPSDGADSSETGVSALGESSSDSEETLKSIEKFKPDQTEKSTEKQLSSSSTEAGSSNLGSLYYPRRYYAFGEFPVSFHGYKNSSWFADVKTEIDKIHSYYSQRRRHLGGHRSRHKDEVRNGGDLRVLHSGSPSGAEGEEL
jgi:hypothetical protein